MKKERAERCLKRVLILLLTLFAVASMAVDLFAQGTNDWTGNINLMMGFKDLDEDDWKAIDEHNEFGIDLDFKNRNWPVSLSGGYLRSYDEDDYAGYDWEAMTSELYLGARKIFDEIPMIRPFIDGGISLTSAEIEKNGVLPGAVSDDDTSFGVWLGGGLYYTLMEQLNIGFNLRYSHAEVTLFDKDFEAGGLHYGLLFGYHW